MMLTGQLTEEKQALLSTCPITVTFTVTFTMIFNVTFNTKSHQIST